MDEEANIASQKGSYKFKYATYSSVIEAIKPIHDFGFSFYHQPYYQDVSGQIYVGVTTTLLHISGQYISCSILSPSPCIDIKAAGSAITYLKRYSIAALIGIPTDCDDDGSSANGDSWNSKKAPPAKPVYKPGLQAPAAQNDRAPSQVGGEIDPYATAMSSITNAYDDAKLESLVLLVMQRHSEGKFTIEQVCNLLSQAIAKGKTVQYEEWIGALIDKSATLLVFNKHQRDSLDRTILKRIEHINNQQLVNA